MSYGLARLGEAGWCLACVIRQRTQWVLQSICVAMGECSPVHLHVQALRHADTDTYTYTEAKTR
eukprot:9372652-Alexandrium_andersonii.AAC.1